MARRIAHGVDSSPKFPPRSGGFLSSFPGLMSFLEFVFRPRADGIEAFI